MQSFHHRLEFMKYPFTTALRISDVGGEEAQWHVAPVISFHRIELLDRHEFNNRYAQFLKVRDLFDNARVGATLFDSDSRVRRLRKALDVQFINDRIVRVFRLNVAFPVKCFVTGGKKTQRRLPGIGAGPACRLTAEVFWKENDPGIRIQENFFGIESVPFNGIEWPLDPIRVILSSRDRGCGEP